MKNWQKEGEVKQPQMDQGNGGFPVDECFGEGIGRPLGELVNEGGNEEGELVTFEEFIRSTSKRRKEEHPAHRELDLRPIDEDDDGRRPGGDDGFFDIVLDGANVPEDPISPEKMAAAKNNKRGASIKGRRSELYAVQEENNEGHRQQHRTLTNSSTISSTTTLRHSFCPTVGEGGGWLSGRTRRESQDSAAYGCEAPEEPSPAPPKLAKKEHQQQEKRQRSGTFIRSTSMQNNRAEGQLAAEEGGEGGRKMVHSTSFGGLMFSKFLCCFRALNPAQLGKGRRCAGDRYLQKEDEVQEQPKCYSWDQRDEELADPKELCFSGLTGETRVKEPGQLNGQPFQIENCTDSLIVLLDNTASITVDDCRNCVILAGPCQGSIFLRDCSNLLILAVCQQFRTRDCRQLVAHLFSTSAPTIEETEMTLAPLLLNYSGLQTQMHSSGISPFVNRWSQVHNFTPESGKCRLSHDTAPLPGPQNLEIVHRFNEFLAHSTIVQQWGLSIGKLRDSRIFVEERNGPKREAKNENALVLIKPAEGTQPGLRFYAESVELTHALLDVDGLKLCAMHDIDLRDGEWEAIIGQQKGGGGGKGKNQTQINKVIAIEIGGAESKGHAERKIAEKQQQAKSGGGGTATATAQLVGSEQMEQYRKQLYRLCEIRQSI